MKSQLLKKILFVSFLFFMFTFTAFAQTEDKIVTITGDATYSGTYVYQGTRSSSSCGTVLTRPYYKCGTHYLYADYILGNCTFPNGFEWVIYDGVISANSPIGSSGTLPAYIGWDGTNGMDFPEECTYWADASGNDKTSLFTITNASSGVAPTVSTLEASLVTTTSGTMGGNIVADGGATTDRGFVFSSTDATPTIGESGVTQITKGTGTGTYTEVVSGLTPGVTYYYQAYGHNTYGTTYGTVKSFTTPTTSQPNKYVSGITNYTAANGVYVWIGEYYGKPAWKHETLNYWVYYSRLGSYNPTSYNWYIDNQLRDEHGAGDYFFYHADAATCPSSGWASGSGNGTGTGTPLVVDYPQIDFTSGASFSPGNPTAGTTNSPVGRFYLDADIAGASLTSATITVSGTRTNVTNLKLWSSTDATFNSGSDTQLNSQSDGSTVSFSGFTSAISTSGTYYFITADLASTSTGTIALTIGSKTNLTYSGGASSTVFTNAALTSGTITIIPSREINIKGNSVSIADGDAAPDLADHTDFGNADIVSGSVVRTFTIENLASGTLSLTDPSPYVVISGATTEFSLTTSPSSGTISGSSSITFQITFNPTSTGLKSATISIANDDGDENPYDFSIQGTGTVAPEMDVSGNGTSISDGHVSPSTSDDTEFGKVNVTTGSPVNHTFTISNSGSANLNLTGTPNLVTLSGHTSDFSITQPVSSVVSSGGGSVQFAISFDPTAAGVRNAIVSISNDDSDENPYTFTIQGTGMTTPTLTTSNAVSISTTSATLGGNVTSDGYSTLTELGVVYSTTNNSPQIGGADVTKDVNPSTATGAFDESIGSFSTAIHYYYQAYAINGEGTSYGGVKEFTTQNTISSISRSGSTPTNAGSVSWTVTFAASATGLTSSNFTLANTGLSSPFITGVSGSGTTWTVTANTGSGSGALGLNFTSNTGLNAEMSNTLPYTGEVYTIDKDVPTLSSSNPADNSATVFLGSNIVLTFDDNLVAGSGNIT
ncbi:MAG TPA: choice-of-anchor D domain-containing protein, partial [Prolixibacteraceae bacterium]|nr:choice-of-anchor D domain-containing protein [Prolixibacteraceae bacterium]